MSIATSTRLPPATTDQPTGSPANQAVKAAKTGSSVKTIAAPTVESRDWAQDCTKKAIAVATTAVASTAAQVPPPFGRCGPAGKLSSEQHAPTVSSCTAA